MQVDALDNAVVDMTKDPIPYSVFFLYMKINSDGSFTSDNYFFDGQQEPIDPSHDPSVENSLGYYVKDMAEHARTRNNADSRYSYLGSGLHGFQFPPRFSYCAFFMDNQHWHFMLNEKGEPIIKFHEEKNGKKYNKHRCAFKDIQLVTVDLASIENKDDEPRQAAVMINRMCNDKNEWLAKGEKEQYEFDLWMAVDYTNGNGRLTIVIDPGGDNLGPPVPPPVMP